MGFLSKAANFFTLGASGAITGEGVSSGTQNKLRTAYTGGVMELNKALFGKGQEIVADYQYKNRDKGAENEMRKSQEAAGLAASQQAADEMKKNATLASSRYAFGGGGSNLQSFTNKGQTKKSILGSF